MEQYPVIWLEPCCDKCEYDGDRRWSRDEAFFDPCDCGAMPVKYVLAPDQPVT